MANNNSFAELITKITAQSNNALKIYKGISDAVSTSNQEVSIEIENPDNPDDTTVIKVPSFGYLVSAINRIDATLKTLENVDGGGSTVRLSDGSYRKLALSKIPSEAPTIKQIGAITNFKFKNNWFFEDLINPKLYAEVDVTGQVPSSTNKVYTERYIMKFENDLQRDVFIQAYNGKSDIDYKSFLYYLIQNKIPYILDSEERDLPMRKKTYTGNFSVTKISSTNVKKTINNTDYTVVEREYILDTLTYTDNTGQYENTMTLAQGDKLEVINDTISTRYEVTAVDNSRLAVRLKLIEGYEDIKVGENVLRMSGDINSIIKVEVPIGYDEYNVVFIKAIDPDSGISAAEFSPGVGFYTSELTYTNTTGVVESLNQFYSKYVVDIGKMLISMAKDYYPTVTEGIVPNVPILEESNFRVVQINKQKNSTSSTEKMQELIANKIQLQSTISSLDTTIKNLTQKIQTTIYDSTSSKSADEQSLNVAVANRNTQQETYTSVINEIASLANSSTYLDEAKYHVRGFWNVPEEQSNEFGTQKIIKFKYRYRYLSLDNTSNSNDEYEYTDSNGNTVKAVYSSWEEGETTLRKRSYNTVTGSYYWEDIDNLDAESIDINQIDIAITSGEKVEIQVASVSEAGYPANPLVSDWSESVIIEYPDDAVTAINANYIEQNKMDLVSAQVNGLLASLEIDKHLQSAFDNDGRYLAHTADQISSGFLTEEQSPITLFDKLTSMSNDIDAIIARISNVEEDVTIDLMSPDGDIIKLNENARTYVFAGYYKEWVDSNISDERIVLDNNVVLYPKAGAIMQKEYYLRIGINSNLRLRLFSKFNGSRTAMVPNSIGNATILANDEDYKNLKYHYKYESYDNIVREDAVDDNYYNTKGRYDLVPINLKSPSYYDFQMTSPNMYQSSQQRGQFIYSRFRDVTNSFNLYANGSVNDKYDEDTNTWTIKEGRGVMSFSKTDTMQRSEIFGCDRWMRPVESEGTWYTLKGKSDDSIYHFTYNSQLSSYNVTETEVKRYNDLVGTEIPEDTQMYEYNKDGEYKDSAETGDSDKLVPYSIALYRLPRTYTYKTSNMSAVTENSMIKARISNLTTDMNDKNKYLNRVAKRNAASELTIIPRIQTAYGFGDYDSYELSDSTDGQYYTTHKIGYSSEDQFLGNATGSNVVGFNTCGSYLFLSPTTHEDIQVEGDSINSYKEIPNMDTKIIVPIIYQSRMTSYPTDNLTVTEESQDYVVPAYSGQKEESIKYEGHILGNKTYSTFSSEVLKATYANIIGIDIWLSNSVLKQYDIIVYSKYVKDTSTNSVQSVDISSAISDYTKKINVKSINI